MGDWLSWIMFYGMEKLLIPRLVIWSVVWWITIKVRPFRNLLHIFLLPRVQIKDPKTISIRNFNKKIFEDKRVSISMVCSLKNILFFSQSDLCNQTSYWKFAGANRRWHDHMPQNIRQLYCIVIPTLHCQAVDRLTTPLLQWKPLEHWLFDVVPDWNMNVILFLSAEVILTTGATLGGQFIYFSLWACLNMGLKQSRLLRP